MQQLPAPGQPEARKLVEDVYDFLGTLLRSWRLIAVFVAITLTVAVIYRAKARPVYQASARLLILQQGGQPVTVASSNATQGSLFQSSDETTLSTHMMIIRSPSIVGRALTLANRDEGLARSVMSGLTVKLPDKYAKVLELGYKTGSSEEEAVEILDAVIKSYVEFLKEKFQKNSAQVMDLIIKARDDLSKDLKRLEKEYLEFRRKNTSTAHVPGDDSRTFITRRLDQWDQAIGQAKFRAIQLNAQLNLGKRLAEEGAGIDVIINALGHVGETSISEAPTAHADTVLSADPKPSLAIASTRLESQLIETEYQRQTAESVLRHLQTENARAAASARKRVSQSDVVDEFSALPEVAECYRALRKVEQEYDHVRRVSRRADEAALVALGKKKRALEAELTELWHQCRPVIERKLAGGGDPQPIRQAAGEVIALRAKETVLREQLEKFRANRLDGLHEQRDRLVKRHGPGHQRVREIEEQIAELSGDANEAPADPRQAQIAALLKSIEQGLKSVDAVRVEVEQRFQQDLAESNRSENGLLEESNLRANLERQRELFHSVVAQLKQAQLVSDYGSITAEVLDPPIAWENRMSIAIVLLAAVLVGGGLGAGVVYVADQLDARIRSLPEIRRLLQYRMLGVIPQLSRAQLGDAPVGLISYVTPRSRVAETYKSIRTGIDLLRRNWEGKVLMVTSPQPSEGKSTTASNLAICMAQSGRRVLLIDADLRRPSQHTIYRCSPDPGLTQVLTNETSLREALQATEVANLDFLPAGAEVPNPAELLGTDRLGALVGELRQSYDIVIFDTPPLLAVTDPSIIAVTIDGIVLVVRALVTRRFDAERSQELLKALETPVLGVIINGIGPGQGGYGGYGHPYGYGTYGRGSSSGKDEDAVHGRLSERAGVRRELPGVGLGSMNGHPHLDS